MDTTASFVMVGTSHLAAPLELLERISIRPAETEAALGQLLSSPEIDGAVVVSTCNRTEIYASCRRFHAGLEALTAFLAARAGVAIDRLVPHLSLLHDDTALTHLFRVAAGTESMVVGETEILGQVQRALSAAQAAGATSPLLERAFGHALRAGRRARAETGVARGSCSLPALAVELAIQQSGPLTERRALVLGAGEMGTTVARLLRRAGAGSITIAGRRPERAAMLAATVGGEAVSVEEMPEALQSADLVFTATTSPEPVLTPALCASVLARRRRQPLVIVDLGLPHDVDPDVDALDGVTLFDLDDLHAAAADSLAARRRHLPDVEHRIAAEVERFLRDSSARQMAPLVSALRCRVEEVRRAELHRWQARLGPLDEEALSLVEAVTAGVVAKLLHGPTMRLKEAAAAPKADLYRDALVDLFDLPA